MKLTDDLPTAKWIYLKGFLFLVTGLLAVAAILLEHANWRTAFLLAVAIWSFCRLYYFAFYVIEKYVDSSYKFAGLTSFAAYLWRQKAKRKKSAKERLNKNASRPEARKYF